MPRHVDFQRIVMILRLRWSCATIASEADVDEALVQRMRRGESQDPRFHAGLALVELFAVRVGRDIPYVGEQPAPRLRAVG